MVLISQSSVQWMVSIYLFWGWRYEYYKLTGPANQYVCYIPKSQPMYSWSELQLRLKVKLEPSLIRHESNLLKRSLWTPQVVLRIIMLVWLEWPGWYNCVFIQFHHGNWKLLIFYLVLKYIFCSWEAERRPVLHLQQ